MHMCQRASARPRAVRKEQTPELLSCLPLTGPCHLLPLQTFVNDVRIPDQKYVTLKLHDVIRFGYDILSGPCPLLLAQVALEVVGAPVGTAALCSRPTAISLGSGLACTRSSPDGGPGLRELLPTSWSELTQGSRNQCADLGPRGKPGADQAWRSVLRACVREGWASALSSLVALGTRTQLEPTLSSPLPTAACACVGVPPRGYGHSPWLSPPLPTSRT